MCHCCALTQRPSGVADCLENELETELEAERDGGPVAGPYGAHRTVDDYTALLSGTSWNGFGVTGQGAFVTYSFDDEANPTLDEGEAFFDTFRPLTAAEREVTRTALSQWADVSGLVFLEVAPGEGDISMGVYDLGSSKDSQFAAGYAYYPGREVSSGYQYFDASNWTTGGDIVMDDDLGSLEYFHDVVLHEIGHAIGLKHPFSGDTVLTSRLDTNANTVMSYTSATPGPATRLGQFDVAAVRHVYGTKDGAHLAGWNWQADAQRLVQTGTGGNDAIFGISVSDTIRGRDGDDDIAGFEGDDVIEGGAGDDRIDGGEGDDVLRGDAGDDILSGGEGADLLDGLAGDDVLIGGRGDDVYHVDGAREYFYADGRHQETGDEIRESRDGGTDTVFTRVSMTLPSYVEIGVAVGAVDLTGRSFDDTLRGSAAANRLDGAFGDDRLFGGGGADVLVGGFGADHLDGGAGFDVADYGRQSGGIVIDLNARVQGGSAAGDVLVGIEGIRGTTVDDIVRGGQRGERFEGLDGDDVLDGRYGNDVLDGGAGNDRLLGGGGNDLLDGGLGADRLDGGIGFDTADYSDAATGIAVDLNAAAQGGGASGDVLVSIEAVRGTASDDAIAGRFAAESIAGGAGDDLLDGRYGDDRLFGGTGADRLIGGAGDDLLDGGAGADVLAGQGGIDTASYRSARGSVTADLFLGGSRGDADGDTYGSVENLLGSALGDRLFGNALDNRIEGGTGFDLLLGRGGNDVIAGGAQNDFLSGGTGDDLLGGGTGDDRLRGDLGADTLFGGTGADLFVYISAADSLGVDSGGAGADTIKGFERDQDRIDLSRIDANGAAPGDGAFTLASGDPAAGSAFSGRAGELRIDPLGGDAVGVLVSADIDGDRVADLRIRVEGVAALSAADLIL